MSEKCLYKELDSCDRSQHIRNIVHDENVIWNMVLFSQNLVLEKKRADNLELIGI